MAPGAAPRGRALVARRSGRQAAMTAPSPPTSYSFGALLKRHRGAAGLSQEELAERAGLGVRTISDLEREVARWPYPATVALLVGALALDAAARAGLEAVARRPTAASQPDDRPQRPHAGAGTVGAPALRLPAALTPFIGREP